MPTKSGASLRLMMSAINVGHREGELSLQLLHEGTPVYLLSFIVCNRGASPHLELGALQGLNVVNGGEVIKLLTRELHGCRPKKLMVEAVRAIGSHLGCERIVLVGNANRVSVNGRRGRRISSDYDLTWKELGAHARSDGNFELPCAATPPDLTRFTSSKRAEAKRRDTRSPDLVTRSQLDLTGIAGAAEPRVQQ